MKRRWIILPSCAFAIAAFACEPPRVYHEGVEVPIFYPVQPINLETGPSGELPDSGAQACSALGCVGDMTISGRMFANSFIESAPIVVDAVVNSPYYVPPNTTTTLVYPNGDTAVLVLPCAADMPGRIIRVKAMGTGWVDIHGAINQGSGILDTIDGDPFYSLVALTGTSYPTVALQAFYDNPLDPPNIPHRTGWAVIAVTP